MGYIYRYTDLADNVVKYIGIVYANRPLCKRLDEHQKNDKWCLKSKYKIDFIEFDSSSTLEALESHLITLYGTDKYYNIQKTNWGLCEFIPDINDKWIEYCQENITKESRHNKYTKYERTDKSFIKINISGFKQIKNKIPKSLQDYLKFQMNKNNGVVTIRKSQDLDVYTLIHGIL